MKSTMKRGPSIANKQKGPQDEMIIVGAAELGYYPKGKLEEVPYQSLLNTGAQISIVHIQVWEQATTRTKRKL